MIIDVSAFPTVARGPAPAAAELVRVPLHGRPAPEQVLLGLSGQAMPFALTGSWAGGGAVLGSEPVALAATDDDPFATLDRLPALPARDLGHPHAVGGGWFGWLGYRLGNRIEQLPPGPPRAVGMPDFHLAYYDHVLRLDPAGQWWFEALSTEPRSAALRARLRQLSALVQEAHAVGGDPQPQPPGPLRLTREAALHHLEAVRDCRERITAGEIFQANICLRLEGEYTGTASELLARARSTVSPAYAAAFGTPDGEVASLSPELFLRRRGARVTTGPIKGTIARDSDPARAAAARQRLQSSAKDAAEHVMIVDLMRNDLGRVCAYGSVVAPREPTAEPHPGLWHLVSRVHGELRPEAGNADLLRATFPPGSVTGAPKVQALKVIAALEPVAREVYTGAIGYCSPAAGLELNVAIRTLELRHGRVWLGAGGGIVADSDPQAELEEALTKARPIAAAVGTRVVVEGGNAVAAA